MVSRGGAVQGEGGYYLTMFEAALEHLRTMEVEDGLDGGPAASHHHPPNRQPDKAPQRW